MLKFIELFVGIVVIFCVVRCIIKGYSTTGVLFIGGLTLLIISALMDHNILPLSKNNISYYTFNIMKYIKTLLMNSSIDFSIMIIMLCGFSAYMTYIGANEMLVKQISKILQCINSPYILMITAYFIACLMSLVISSATGLGIILMTTLFLVMVNVGISFNAAAAICASPGAIILSPISGDVVLTAKITKIPLIDLTFKIMLPISISAIIGMAIAHYFWQKFLDKRENFNSNLLDANKITTTAPAFYAILPFTPIIGMFIFDNKWDAQVYITIILIICILFAAALEFIRDFNIHKVFNGLKVVYRSMVDAFTRVVILLTAAGIFTQGLSAMGFIKNLILIATSFGSTSIILMLVMTVLTMLVAVTTGSGNASFYTLSEMIPELSHSFGINLIYLSIPMLQASNLGRTISPVSGVIITIAEIAKISPFELIKRTSVPVIFGLIIVIITTEILIPSHLLNNK